MTRSGETRFGMVAAAYVVACLVFGGASAAGVIANLLLQLLALPLAWVAIVRLSAVRLPRPARAALLLAGLTFLLPLLQLIPLPPSLWIDLPGRGEMLSVITQMGVQPGWLGISMGPWLTIASWLSLFPAMALFLAGLTLSESARSQSVIAIVGVAVLSVVIGALQMSGGEASALYFYQITNVGSAVGFFANRNHQASLLLITVPFLSLLFRSAGVVEVQAPAKQARRLAIAVLGGVILIGILFSGSRAGIILLVPAVVLSIAATLRTARGVAPMPWLFGAAALAVVAIGSLSYSPVYDRMIARSSAMVQDVRFWSAPYSWTAAMDNAPVGSGFGTFDPVFRRYAGSANLGPSFVNHAHNDYLELFMTGGVPALVLLLAFLIWFAQRAAGTWRLRSGHASAIARSAQVVILLLLLHSLVDYPLRTAAISAVFALSVALQIRPLSGEGAPDIPSGHGAAMPRRSHLSRRSRQPALPVWN